MNHMNNGDAIRWRSCVNGFPSTPLQTLRIFFVPPCLLSLSLHHRVVLSSFMRVHKITRYEMSYFWHGILFENEKLHRQTNKQTKHSHIFQFAVSRLNSLVNSFVQARKWFFFSTNNQRRIRPKMQRRYSCLLLTHTHINILFYRWIHSFVETDE